MDLYFTPLSHFTRKVRILLDLYELDYNLVDVGNVAKADQQIFNNPLMKVPVLIDDDNWIIDSDHIAYYVVKKLDPLDKYGVKSEDIFSQNTKAILNNIMAEDVKIILAKRANIKIDQQAFFEKSVKSIQNGLEWLEAHAENFKSESFQYKDIHLVCAWEHLQYYNTVPLLYPKLNSVIRELEKIDTFKQTSPLSRN